jgi:hypothetical protein
MAKFIDVLNLTPELKEKLELFQAKPVEYEGVTHYKVYFNALSKLDLKDVSELMRKVNIITSNKEEYEKINIKNSDIFVLNNKESDKA